jgi:5-(carboxyamino)imidazole ribonucleotide synthase
MENLIGDEADGLAERLRPGRRPHLYGKAESRPGRKMGHLTRILAKTPRK